MAEQPDSLPSGMASASRLASRPAFGVTELGKISDEVEQLATWTAPVLDLVFGQRPEEKKEGHDAGWWAKQRPRPYRGPTADPSGPAAERAEYFKNLEEEREKARRLREDKEAIEREERQRLAEEGNIKFAMKAAMDAASNRVSFFGRPCQKLRLLKMDRQLERNEREQQAAMFKHLQLDSQVEKETQKKRIKVETSRKNKAVAMAADLRAREKGAIAAADGLKVGGGQLLDARVKAQQAAEDYGTRAEEQENIARNADDEIFDAEEIVMQEEEKIRACEAQVLMNKHEASILLEECVEIENKEAMALVEEGVLLRQFIEDWSSRVKSVARGSPAWQQIQKQLNNLARREAVVEMEKKMFAPSFITMKGGGEDPFKTVTITAAAGKKITQLAKRPRKQPFMWVADKQHPGMVCLGKAIQGPLTERQKVVIDRGNNEFPEIELPEYAISDMFERAEDADDEHLNAAPHIELHGDYLEGIDGAGLFLSRKLFEMGETEASTALDKDMFKKLWGQDKRHEVIITMLEIKVKLRYKPPYIWTAGWVNGSKEAPNKYLLTESKLGGLSSKKLSLTLGPRKKPFEDCIVPGLHDEDRPDDINAPDMNPRLSGFIDKWNKEFGDEVKEGDVIALVEVENEREALGKKRSLYTPPSPDAPGLSEREKKKAQHHKDKYEVVGERYLAKVLAPATGKLCGLMLKKGSKVESFMVIAWVDTGDKDWDKCLLPIAEWPPVA